MWSHFSLRESKSCFTAMWHASKYHNMFYHHLFYHQCCWSIMSFLNKLILGMKMFLSCWERLDHLLWFWDRVTKLSFCISPGKPFKLCFMQSWISWSGHTTEIWSLSTPPPHQESTEKKRDEQWEEICFPYLDGVINISHVHYQGENL